MFLARKHFKKSNSDSELKLEQVESGENSNMQADKDSFYHCEFCHLFFLAPSSV